MTVTRGCDSVPRRICTDLYIL